MFVAHYAASLIEYCFGKNTLSEIPAIGTVFFFTKLTTIATTISIVAGYRALRLIKIGAKVVRHSRYVTFQMAEVLVSKRLFQEILEKIHHLKPIPIGSG